MANMAGWGSKNENAKTFQPSLGTVGSSRVGCQKDGAEHEFDVPRSQRGPRTQACSPNLYPSSLPVAAAI